MARFETSGQILSLFAGAAAVAVLLILLLNVEVHKREVGEEKLELVTPVAAEEQEGLLHRITKYFRSLQNTSHRREKRSLSEDDGVNNQTSDQHELEEALLGTQNAGHKIRHLGEKIHELGRDSDLVKTVLKLYCPPKEVYYMTQFANCTQVQYNVSNESSAQDNNTINHSSGSDEETEKEKVVAHHQPLLDENNNHKDLSPEEYSALSECHCELKTHTLLVIFITTLVNAAMLLGIMGFVRVFRYCNQRDNQDKIWLCEEDDLATLRDDPPRPIVGRIALVA